MRRLFGVLVLLAMLSVPALAQVNRGRFFTYPAHTSGSVTFIGADGELVQDNSGLFFDSVADRLGIGTAAPLSTVHIGPGTDNSAQTRQLEVNNTGTAGQVWRDSTNDVEVFLNAHSTGVGFFGTTTLHDLVFRTFNTAALTLESDQEALFASNAKVPNLLDTDGSNFFETACSNQAVTDISSAGTFTCSSINNGWWSGTDLTVANGGTGFSSCTDGGIVLGSGTSPLTCLGVATNGQIPIGDGTTDPQLNTISGTGGITITNGPGTIDVSPGAALTDRFVQMWSSGFNADSTNIAGSTSAYCGPMHVGNCSTANSTSGKTPVPFAGTVSKLYVVTRTAQPGTGTLVFEFYKNGSATALKVTVSAGAAAGTFSDLSNTASVSAGDEVQIVITNNASTGSAQIAAFSMQMVPS